ncbi:MAG: CAAX prenyl protease-related protein [Pirellulaceae bacterium]
MSQTITAGKQRHLAAFVCPFVLYVVLTSIAARFPSVYPLAYTFAVVVVGAAIFMLLRGQHILQRHWRVAEAILFGFIGIAIWIALSSARLEEALTASFPSWLRPQARVAFDPFAELPLFTAIGFIAVRLFGLAVITPIAEELFWRGFLLRWLISPDWEEVPLGRFSLPSFVLVTLLFTSAHPEWFAAAVYCALLNALLYWKKDLWSCVVAHGVSNLALGVYVLSTGTWSLW